VDAVAFGLAARRQRVFFLREVDVDDATKASTTATMEDDDVPVSDEKR